MDLSRGQKLLILIGLFALLGGVVVLSVGKVTSAPVPVVYEAPKATTASSGQQVGVHVAGAVTHPGMYWLRPGSRVTDAITAAGGMLVQADQSSVNLAAVVEDGQQIKVAQQAASPAPETSTLAATSTVPGPPPSQAAPAAPATPPSAALTKAPGVPLPLSLNQATKDQLQALPEIGPALAERIIYYRYAHGGFKSLEELGQVDGIGPKRVASLRPYLKL